MRSRTGNRTRRLLLLSDDAATAERVSELARTDPSVPDRVLWTRTPARALQLLADEGIDAVLVDLSMEERLGWPVCAEICRRFSSLPVVMLAHRLDRRTIEAHLREGAEDYLLLEELTSETLVATITAAQNRTRDELRARRSGRAYERLYRSGLLGIAVTDERGLALDVNDALLEMLGWSRRDYEARRVPWGPGGSPEAPLLDPEVLLSLAQSSDAEPHEATLRRADGAPVTVHLGVTALADLDGEYVVCVVAAPDGRGARGQILAQYAVATALAGSGRLEERAIEILRALAESFDWDAGAIWTVDWERRALSTVAFWSRPGLELPAFREATRTLEFALGHGMPGRVWASGRPEWVDDAASDPTIRRAPVAARDGIHTMLGFPIRLGEGGVLGVIELSTRKHRRPQPEMLQMVESVGHQIAQFLERHRTEAALARAEENLRHAQRMEAIGRLAGGIAHDFNNLLSAIVGFTELAIDRVRDDDVVARDLEEVRKAGLRAAELTRQLLAFSRKQVLEPRVVNLNDIVAELESMLRRLIPENIEIDLRLDPDARPVRVDVAQCEQVILNLVVNARDAMPAGGRLTVETVGVGAGAEPPRRGRAPAGEGDEFTQLLVRDTGVGMDEETLGRIFEPYFTTKGAGQGTGLGLGVVYGVVRQSGGRIDVRSRPGRGTEFSVLLPVAAEERPHRREAEPQVAAAPERNGTVLLVEDDDAVRDLARSVLERAGIRVIAVDAPGGALRMADDTGADIDLVVTDVVLPEMSGFDLVERLRDARPSLRALYMSGYAEGEVVRAGDGYLAKPFTNESLLAKVRSMLPRR